MQTFKKATFNGAVKRLGSRTTEVKAIVQTLIEMGCDHYLKSGDTVYLNTAMAQCIGTRALPNAQIQDYCETVANVEWCEVKTKRGVKKTFIKVLDRDDNDKVIKTPAIVDTAYVNSTSWFDHASEKNSDKPHTEVDKFLKQIKSMITKGRTALEEERVDGDVDAFEALVTELEGIK